MWSLTLLWIFEDWTFNKLVSHQSLTIVKPKFPSRYYWKGEKDFYSLLHYFGHIFDGLLLLKVCRVRTTQFFGCSSIFWNAGFSLQRFLWTIFPLEMFFWTQTVPSNHLKNKINLNILKRLGNMSGSFESPFLSTKHVGGIKTKI